MKKIAIVLVFFIVFFGFIFLNLGKYLDVTASPVKSDIIVCLGGGTIERVKKSISLFEQGFSKEKVLLLLGESWYNQPYILEHHPDIPLLVDERPKNTIEELVAIKQYMKTQGYKSALIVTDPPHSRRVKLLTSLVSLEEDKDMTFRMIGSDVGWWDAEKYYKSERSRASVWHEIKGIIYSLGICGIGGLSKGYF